jgi:LuxR family maltose regulon positive regulatory protein
VVEAYGSLNGSDKRSVLVGVPVGASRSTARPGVVRRDRLVREFAAVPDDVPLILVVAGAGFGKTTALGQWAADDARPFGWVSLDSSDGDPIHLLRRIAETLHEIQALDDAVWDALASRGVSPVGVVVPRLIASLQAESVPWILAVDDLHAVAGSATPDMIVALARGLPRGCHLVVASRNRSGLRLARLRLEGKLAEFGPESLAFTHREAAAVLTVAGSGLPEDAVRAVMEHTEGWPAGVYLTALALRDRVDPAAAAAEIAGSDAFIAEYFWEEVLGRESPEVMRFLRRTAVLEHLSGALCDAVLGTSGSAARLAGLAARNLFVVPEDGDGQWYRYHRLLAETLLAELRRREPAEELGLHTRAAAWCETNGQAERAVAHALAGGDRAAAARLVTRYGLRTFTVGLIATVQGWLGALDDGALDSYPPLAVSAGWIWALTGESAKAYRCLRAAEQGSFEGVPPDGSVSMESAIARLRAVVAPNGVEQMRADAHRVVDLEPPAGPWHVLASTLLGVAELLNGAVEAARSALERADVLGRESQPAIAAFALAQLSLLAAERDDWPSAEAAGSDSATLVDSEHLTDYMPSLITYAANARVALHRGDVASARRCLGNAMRLYAVPSPVAMPWLAAQSAIVLGRILLDLDDIDAARGKATDAGRHLAGMPSGGILTEQHRQLIDALDRHPGRARPIAGMTVTPAEQRVLQLLTTHLTLGEIAEQLHISRNTVKTHAISVYRKLNASTRTEAVREARSLGLLPP